MELTEEQKLEGMQRIREGFEDIESLITLLKRDIESKEKEVQLSSVFISVELIKMVAKFTNEIKRLSELRTPIAMPKSNIYVPPNKRYES
ncbi:MAG TPA: hypothetical protein VK616_12605 [Flavitalea sp.]|nr:hypothetical protein [Flavitalea sp.]